MAKVLRKPQKRSSIAVSVIMTVVFAIGGIAMLSNRNHDQGPETIAIGQLMDDNSQVGSAQKVYMGIQLLDISQIHPADSTWNANFYLWMRWSGDIDPTTDWQIINPGFPAMYITKTYSYTNEKGLPEPFIMASGEKYQFVTVSAQFVNNFDMTMYPIDTQQLEINIESAGYNRSELVYLPDTSAINLHKDFAVDGWTLDNISVFTQLHHYDTSFGLGVGDKADSDYSIFRTTIDLTRPISHAMWKMFLPMFIVFLVALFSLLLNSDRFDVRLALAGSSLLALIFLQMGYTGELPSPSPLVLMDQIYALAYCALILTIGRIIWTADGIVRRSQDPSGHFEGDAMIAIATLIAFFVGVFIVINN